MADRFTESGGQIRYNTMVEKVQATNGAAIDGRDMMADAVIVTQDALAGKYPQTKGKVEVWDGGHAAYL